MCIKKYFCKTENLVFFVGETQQIKAMYKSMARCKNTNLAPLYLEFPKFREQNKIYAICVDENDYFFVVNSDTMLDYIVSGEVTSK